MSNKVCERIKDKLFLGRKQLSMSQKSKIPRNYLESSFSKVLMRCLNSAESVKHVNLY